MRRRIESEDGCAIRWEDCARQRPIYHSCCWLRSSVTELTRQNPFITSMG